MGKDETRRCRPCLCFQRAAHHGLHARSLLFLFLAALHVLQVLLRFAERLQEGVEDPEELVRLHVRMFLSKVLQRFGKLGEEHRIMAPGNKNESRPVISAKCF